ncbi:unnamed protein product [Jaminaea pallidilutea]
MLSTRRVVTRRRSRTTALVAVATLVTATVAPISATAAAINVVRSDDAPFSVIAKRAANINAESVNKIKGSTVPQGPILLVLCALAVAFLCLVFVVIKVVVPGSTLASGKKITEERARAKTVLRIRGAAGSIRADRRAMTNTTDSSLNSMSDSALKSDAGFKTVVPHFNQHDDRSDSTPSSSSSSDVGKSYPFMRQGVARQSSLNHQQQRSARPPPRPTTNRTSTLFRGTDLNISRQPSNSALHQVASNSSSTRAAPPMQQHGHNNSGDFYSPSQSPSQSRRNSDVNLLLDSTPVSQHPLLPSGRRPQPQHHNYQQQPQLAPVDSRSRAANRYADIEHAPVEDARPGQFHQPVAQGNGRRGRPGSIVGQSGGGGVNGSGVPDGYPMSVPGGF